MPTPVINRMKAATFESTAGGTLAGNPHWDPYLLAAALIRAQYSIDSDFLFSLSRVIKEKETGKPKRIAYLHWTDRYHLPLTEMCHSLISSTTSYRDSRLCCPLFELEPKALLRLFNRSSIELVRQLQPFTFSYINFRRRKGSRDPPSLHIDGNDFLLDLD